MDSFEFNKMAGALLGTLVICMGVGIIGEAVFSHPSPKPGDDLPIPKASASQGAGAPAPAVPLPVLLAKADPNKGANDAHVCETCHNFEKGAGPKIGPPLYGVVGRAVASVPGFDYSDALKKKGGTWTYDKLFQWIMDPSAYAPGTKMAFAGEPDPERRADILAYLRTLSDSPVPFPAVAKAAPPPPPGAPGAAKAPTGQTAQTPAAPSASPSDSKK